VFVNVYGNAPHDRRRHVQWASLYDGTPSLSFLSVDPLLAGASTYAWRSNGSRGIAQVHKALDAVLPTVVFLWLICWALWD
jgi:hypothetical protein